ncbi:MAG: hypothetical protein M3Y87_10355 [Myxococcota bacterium]|nr:hypothetical protein [Myxococcota bacterium]
MTCLRSVIVLLVLVSALVSGCAGSHGLGDAGGDAPSPARDAAPPRDGPLTCELRDGRLLVLEPEPGNPVSCTTPAPCELWFGHGQHLRCPRSLGTTAPLDVECSIWDCVCDDGMGFVANFATTEVVDTREAADCRYRIVFE